MFYHTILAKACGQIVKKQISKILIIPLARFNRKYQITVAFCKCFNTKYWCKHVVNVAKTNMETVNCIKYNAFGCSRFCQYNCIVSDVSTKPHLQVDWYVAACRRCYFSNTSVQWWLFAMKSHSWIFFAHKPQLLGAELKETIFVYELVDRRQDCCVVGGLITNVRGHQ